MKSRYEATERGKQTITQIKKDRKARTPGLLQRFPDFRCGQLDMPALDGVGAIVEKIYESEGGRVFRAGVIVDLWKLDPSGCPAPSLGKAEECLDQLMIRPAGMPRFSAWGEQLELIKHPDFSYEVLGNGN